MMQHTSNVCKYLLIGICLIVICVSIIVQIFLKRDIGVKLIKNSEYDYIIVGGGTVGCVLAAKLSANSSNKILLIEAGDEFGFSANVPLLATLLQGSKNDWAFKSKMQEYSSFGLFNYSQALPRGKGLGGSGMINYLIHGEAVLDDFKNWKIPNWEFHNLYPYMKTPNNYETSNCDNKQNILTDDFCPMEKPKPSLHLSNTNCDITNYFKKAISELKKSDLQFVNTNVTVFEGKRWTSYHAYLKPVIDRKNLDVVLNTRVAKVLFKNKIAIGIETINTNNEKILVYSKNDIILSAGALHSPQILLLSGIGPKKALKKLGIPIVVDLPGVGENLHDQLNMPMYVSIDKPITVTVNKVYSLKQFWDYFFYGEGLLSRTPMAGMMKGPNDTGLLLFAMGSTDETILREVANYRPEIFQSLFPLYKNSSQEGFVFLPSCLQPKSRGFVYLKDNNPLNLPVVDPNYLSDIYDVECTIKAMQFAMSIIETKVFQELGAKLHWPLFRNCQHLPVEPLCEDYLECIIRTVALTAHHPGGTCKIGDANDKMAVVDGNLRVKHVKGLRIMDASILQKPLSTFPNDLLINLAEYAADIITRN